MKSRAILEAERTRTGDKYEKTSDGRFVCCGRTDDMFKVSGQRVSPFEVEQAPVAHPAVPKANLRFAGPETMETRIFGRLTAWQNLIIQRPSTVGESGAPKRYGSGRRLRIRQAAQGLNR